MDLFRGGRVLFGRGGLIQTPDWVHECIDNNCCECWKEGCGLDGCYGCMADGFELFSPMAEALGNAIWCFGSPLAFPIIFCFSSNPHTNESSGYKMPMILTPRERPIMCCLSTFCALCAQFHVRRVVLGNDMIKYKLWQGYHDGPHCLATRCEGAPLTIEAGTYGEQDCPNAFLCLEVTVLGCYWSTCCAFEVSRRYQREERGLGIDPTEQRQRSCIQFFSGIMHKCFMLGCCVCVSSYCVGLCAPDSEGAQECSGEAGRAARACCRIAHILWKGIQWTKVIGMGCMTTQMLVEAETPYNPADGPKQRPELQAPKAEKMNDRGFDGDNNTANNDDDDALFPWQAKKNRNDTSGGDAPTSMAMNRGNRKKQEETKNEYDQ